MPGRLSRIASSSVTLVFLTLAAMSCTEGIDPVAPPGPKPPEVPSPQEVTITAVTSTLITGVVGTTVDERPTVRITDRNGNPVAGFPINFVVTRGSGWADPATVTSNAAGFAGLSYWHLGARPDTNVVVTRMGNHPPVTFRVVTVAGAPLLFGEFDDDQVVQPGSRVPASPAVAALDMYGNPVAGVSVSFSALNPDDEITGASGVTGPDGKVRLDSWKVGALGGHRVMATAAGMTPVVFSVVAIDEGQQLCQVQRVMSGPRETAILGAGTCSTAAGRYFDTYSIDAVAGFQTFRMESTTFDSYLQIFAPDGMLIATNDNADRATRNSLVRIYLPAGEVKLTGTSLSAGLNGAYEVRRESFPVFQNPCDPAFVVRGVELQGTLSRAACGEDAVHHYRIYLKENSTVEADVETMDYSNLYVKLSTTSGLVLADGEPVRGTYHTRFSYRAPTSGFYTINVSSSDEEALYQLVIR